jgi:hypothetical protein
MFLISTADGVVIFLAFKGLYPSGMGSLSLDI